MATSSFDRTFIVTDKRAKRKLDKILNSNAPKPPRPQKKYTNDDLARGEELLKRCLSAHFFENT